MLTYSTVYHSGAAARGRLLLPGLGTHAGLARAGSARFWQTVVLYGCCTHPCHPRAAVQLGR